MEALIGLVILFFILKFLPKIWFILLFLGASFVLLIWMGFLHASGLAPIIGIISAIAGGWAFAKSRT